MAIKNLYVTKSSRIVEKIDDIEPSIVTLNKLLRDGINYDNVLDISYEIMTEFIAPENGAIAVSGKQKEYLTLVPEPLFLLEIYRNNKLIAPITVDTKCMDTADDVSYFVTFIEKDMKIRLRKTYIELDPEYRRIFKFSPFKEDFNLKNNAVSS